MKANPVRGLKYGALATVLLIAILAANHWLRGEAIEADELISGGLLAFVVFGLINTFTDKIGAVFGDV